MKKSTKIGMSLLFLLLFTSMISTTVYMYYMGNKQTTPIEEAEKTETTESTETEEASSETEDWSRFFTTDFYESTFPKIGVSAVTAPIGENIVSTFRSNIPEGENVLYYGTIEDNIRKLLSREYDIIFSPALSDELLEIQREYPTDLDFIPISNEALVFLVSQKNSIQNLYLEDIQNIYSGNTKTWENFTREDEAIIAYQKPENSLIQYLFCSLVLPKDMLMIPPQEIRPNAEKELESMISCYDGGEYAIGYDTYYYAKDIVFDYNVKMLSIDGIYPTKKNISKGIYPVMTNYYAIVRENSYTGSPERKLVDYLTSPTGQELIQESGYIPLG